MLRLYRRHRKACGQTSEKYRRCRCPIYVEGSLAGETIRKSLNLTSWEAASDLVTKWDAAGEIGAEKTAAPAIKKAVEEFITDARARGLREPTIQKISNLLERRLLAWCTNEGYTRLNQLDVVALRRFRATWNDAPISASKNLERLRGFFRFCHQANWVKTNPMVGVKPPKVTPKPTLPFTREEVDSIVEAVDQYPERNAYGHNNRARLLAFVLTLRYSGLRIRDCATLECGRLQKDKLFLYQAKTGIPVYVPLPQKAVEALEKITNGPRFFWSGNGLPKTAVADWQRSLRKLFKLAKVEKGHAHRFRDTFAVELLLAGVPIDQVSTLLGHSSIRITEKHYSPWVKARQEQLESAVRKAW